MMLSRRTLSVTILTLMLACVPAARAERAQGKPNVLFILVDDLGYMDIEPNNPDTFYETSNINRLAAGGMRFTSAYAACPVCSPTRASIMTGKYPVRTGVTDYINLAGHNQPEKWNRRTPLLPAPYRDRLALEEVTLAEALKQGGYATFLAGKWHLGPKGFYPEDQGFDINKGGCEWGYPGAKRSYFSPYGLSCLDDGPTGEHMPERLADETVKFIATHRDKPFFAYLSFHSVHTPLMARPDLKAKYDKKRDRIKHDGPEFGTEGSRQARLVQNHAVYAGMVEAMDQAVGKVLDALDRFGLGERTIVFFMSDNGGLSTSEGHPTSNLPLRAGKGWLYEGGIREPMIVRWPGVTQPKSVCDAPVISTDFYPTILEMAGLPLRPEQHLDGASIVPLLEGGDVKPKRFFWHYPHYGNQGGAPGSAVREGDWKLIEWLEDGRLELYNLKDDLGEQHNLADAHPQQTSRLHELLENWRKETGAKMPTPNKKGSSPSG